MTADPSSNVTSDATADALRHAPPELAAWTENLLVNRTDVWGAYTPLADRGRKYQKPDGTTVEVGKSYTRPRKGDRGKLLLTPAIITRHFCATGPEHVIGLHSTSPENTSRWGAVESDKHDDNDDAEANWRATLAWYGKAKERGFRPLFTDSNGVGGYHLRLIFSEPQPTAKVYAYLQSLVSDYADYGLAKPPETFPKQAAVAPPGQQGEYGNWLRIPGLHHTREHWSKVWSGDRWLSGNEAIDYILSLTGDPGTLLPDPTTEPPRGPTTPTPSQLKRRATGGADVQTRAVAYLNTLPPAISGQGGHNATMTAARAVVYGFDLGPDVGYGLLASHYNLRCVPPWSEGELRHKVDEADTVPFDKPRGYLRDAEREDRRHRPSANGHAKTSSNGTGGGCGGPPSDDQNRDGEPAGGEGSEALADPIHLTDRGNGIRLARIHGRDLRHCFPWRKWLCWDGTRWRSDDTAAVTRRAKAVLVVLFRRAQVWISEIEKELEEAGLDGEQGTTEGEAGGGESDDGVGPQV